MLVSKLKVGNVGTKLKSLRFNCYQLITFQRDGSYSSLCLSLLIQGVIVLNVAAVVLESVASVRQALGVQFFQQFELASIAFFSIEYLLRLWTCVEETRFASPVMGRIRYLLTPLAILDFLAIAPFFLAAFTADLRILRLLRMVRLLRLGKLARYSRAFRVLTNVFRQQKEELITSFFIFSVFVIISSSLMYYVEHDAQPEVFSSIPASMWWAIVTLTTVGYGDAVPFTGLGKLIAAVDAVIGIAFFALLAGVLVTGFTEEMKKDRQHSQ